MEHFNWIVGFVFPYINFFIFITILYIYALPALHNLMGERKKTFQKSLEESRRAENIAREQSLALQKRLGALPNEMTRVLDLAKKTAKEESERILSDAKRLVQHLAEETKRKSEQELNDAQEELTKKMVSFLNQEIETKFSSRMDLNSQLAYNDQQIADFKVAKKQHDQNQASLS